MEVRFSNVGYIYNNGTDFSNEVLKDVSFDFKKGCVHSIVGKSGSGKTTILELINALIKPTKGTIDVGSFRLEKDIKISNINSMRVKVGLVFQFPEEQFFCKTVKQEIAFGMNCFHYKTNTIEKRVIDSLKMVGLDETYLEKDPFTLSHGEMRAVAIASVLIFNPKVILLDEPTVGLDGESKKNLIRLIRMLRTRYSKNIIIVSHDTDFLLKVSDTVSVLEDGKIVFVFVKIKDLERCGISNLDSYILVNNFTGIQGTDMTVVLTEDTPNFYFVSFRGNNNVRCDKVAEAFGGGGHMMIAGAQVEGKTIEEVKNILKQIYNKMCK